MTSTDASFPNVQVLSDHVTRVLGLNPGPFTLQGTNTYLVGHGPRRVLIDTGEGIEGYPALLREALDQSRDAAAAAATTTTTESPTVARVLLTHWHRDHVGGLSQVCHTFPELNSSADKFPEPDHDGQPATSSRPGIQALQGTADHTLRPLADGDLIPVEENCVLKTLHTPGHTRDHVAFWLENERSIFTGDCVLGSGSTVFEDLPTYLNSLKRLQALEANRLYPGHGPIVEGKDKVYEKFNEYIAHRQDRENEILKLLAGQPNDIPPTSDSESTSVNTTAGGWTADQLVSVIYNGYPSSVRNAAIRGILLHLLKLKGEERVVLVPGTVPDTPKVTKLLQGTRLDSGDSALLLTIHWTLKGNDNPKVET